MYYIYMQAVSLTALFIEPSFETGQIKNNWNFVVSKTKTDFHLQKPRKNS